MGNFGFFCLRIRRPPKTTTGGSSAASEVYKSQELVRAPWHRCEEDRRARRAHRCGATSHCNSIGSSLRAPASVRRRPATSICNSIWSPLSRAGSSCELFRLCQLSPCAKCFLCHRTGFVAPSPRSIKGEGDFVCLLLCLLVLCCACVRWSAMKGTFILHRRVGRFACAELSCLRSSLWAQVQCRAIVLLKVQLACV